MSRWGTHCYPYVLSIPSPFYCWFASPLYKRCCDNYIYCLSIKKKKKRWKRNKHSFEVKVDVLMYSFSSKFWRCIWHLKEGDKSGSEFFLSYLLELKLFRIGCILSLVEKFWSRPFAINRAEIHFVWFLSFHAWLEFVPMISVLATIYSVPTVWFSTWWWLFFFPTLWFSSSFFFTKFDWWH